MKTRRSACRAFIATAFFSALLLAMAGVSPVVSQSGGSMAERPAGNQYFMVPENLARDLPDDARVIHAYAGSVLVRSPGLPESVRLRASELEDLDSLSYRAWQGNPGNRDPMAFAPDANRIGYFLLGLAGPMDPAWRRDLQAADLTLVDHASPYGVLVHGSAESVHLAAEVLRTSEGFPVIRGALPLPDESRLSPRLAPWVHGRKSLDELGIRTVGDRGVIQVTFHSDVDPAIADMMISSVVERGPDRDNFGQYLATGSEVAQLLEQFPQVALIHGVHPRVLLNNLSAKDYVINVEPVWNDPELGYTGAGIISGINDSGLDLDHLHFPPAAIVATLGAMSNTDSAHGTHVTGSVAARPGSPSPENLSSCGDQTTPLPDGRGMAWEALITHNNIFDGGSGSETAMMQWHAGHGAVINNNSWGYGGITGPATGYDSETVDVDVAVRDADPSTGSNHEMSIVFAAGNDGPGNETVGKPGNAKNVISVGASQNDRCGEYIPEYCSGPDINAMACFSSRGPSQGRIKPDVVAPGTDVLSSNSNDPQADNPWDAPWTGQEYGIMPGTSMASPTVAGAATVFYEFYNDQFGNMPSPALVKAALINTATDMGFGFPSMDQGWGRINLGKAITGPVDDGIVYIDQDEVDHLQTGQNWTIDVDVADANTPFKVSVVWTDPAGSAGCDPCHVNDLDLIVTAPDGTIYRGNQFTGAWSVPNPGDRDELNNVENVYVETPQTGEWSIEVTSVNTAQNPPNLNGQDFAVVYSGGLAAPCEDPDAPSNLSALTAATDNTIDLSWDGVTADSYNVYRSDTSGGPYTQVASGITGTSHSDTGVSAGEEKFYVVAALNDPGCESGFSNEDSATATGFACSELDAPENLDTTVVVDGEVYLDWSGVPEADSYNIYRADESGGPYDQIATDVLNEFYTDDTVQSGETYYYVVTAVHQDSGCESDESSESPISLAPAIDVSPEAMSFQVETDGNDIDTLNIENVGTEDLNWSILDDESDVNETLEIPDFSVSGGGATEVFDIPGGVESRGDVTGFGFEGTVSGISGSGDWASDLKLVMTAPEGPDFDVGGYDNVVNDWDFDGATDDGTYTSNHPGVFPDTLDLGDWNFAFTHDWSGGGTMNWSDVTVELHKTALAECDDPENIGWLTLNPMSGVITPSDVEPVSVEVDASGLAADTYNADVCVASNDPDDPVVIVPIQLTVTEGDPNPEPTLTNIDPDEAEEGSGELTLTATGSDFISDSEVRWDGSALSTTYISETGLTAIVPESELTEPGMVDVTVFNPGPGGGETAPQVFTITEFVCPEVDAPANLAASAPDDNLVSLTWDSVAGADSYSVYRATESGGPYDPIATGVTATSHDDTSVSAGTTYYYVVTAVEDGCESDFSAESSATATGDCTDEPAFGGLESVTANESFCGLKLEWSAGTASCPGGDPLVYNVYRSTDPGFEPGSGNLVGECITDEFYNDTAVATGTEYHYVVRAEDATANGQGMCQNGNEDSNTTEVSGTLPAGGEQTLYSNDFESGSGFDDWGSFELAGTTANDWQGIQECGGEDIFRFGAATCDGDYGTDNFAGAEPLPGAGIEVPSDATGVTWSINHRWNFSERLGGGAGQQHRDGGALAVSLDDGNSYVWVEDGEITGAGYTDFTFSNQNCLPADADNVHVFSADQDTFVNSEVDLDAVCNRITGGTGGCAGETVHTWFVGITDCQSQGFALAEGWFINDVTITADGGEGQCGGAGVAGEDAEFFTVASGDGHNKLEWLNPSGGSYQSTDIWYRTDRFPTEPGDGTALTSQGGSQGQPDSFSHNDLTNETTYYYGLFVLDGNNNHTGGQFTRGRPQDTSGPVKWIYNTGASAMSPPGIGSVYAASNDRVLHGMNSGAILGDWPAGWKPHKMNRGVQARPPVVPVSIGNASRVVFAGAQDGRVYAVDADTGEQIWQSDVLGDMIQASIAGMFTQFGGDFDLVFAGTRNSSGANQLHALNIDDGTVAWTFDNGGGSNGIGIINGGASVDYANNRVYFASRQLSGGATETLWALDIEADGAGGSSASLAWAGSHGNIDGGAILRDGVVYAGTNDSRILAVDATNGDHHWTFNANDGPVKGFVWALPGSELYFSTSGTVWAIDDNGGSASQIWQQDVSSPSIPLVFGPRVLVGSGDGHLHKFDRDNGSVMDWDGQPALMLGTGNAAVGAPSFRIASNRLKVGTDAGAVYAVELE